MQTSRQSPQRLARDSRKACAEPGLIATGSEVVASEIPFRAAEQPK